MNSSTALATYDGLLTFGDYKADPFNNPNNPPGTGPDDPITDQYLGQGVLFGDGLFYDTTEDPVLPNMYNSRLKNYTIVNGACGPGGCQPFSIYFTSAVYAVSFVAATYSSSPSTFSAYLNDVLVETFTVETNYTNTSNFFGFTDILLDEIRVDPAYTGTHTMIIDNLHWLSGSTISPVPVPAAVWLFCSGLLAMSVVARRRNKA